MVGTTIEKIHVNAEYLSIEDIVDEDGFYEKVKEEYGMRQIRHSCIADSTTEELFRSFLRGKKIKKVVEIGTFYGTATAVLAHYADKVVTIDIKKYNNEPLIIWLNTGVINKIEYYIINKDGSGSDKKQVLDSIGEFDFAFVDGNHREGVIEDWNLVKKCGRVLFHDYFHDCSDIPGMNPEWGAEISEYILELVDSLPQDEVVIKEPFAYWEAK